jgi:predicted dehydrogenase
MSEKVRVALAGLGSVSQRGILPHLAQDDARQKMELVACCDVVGERAADTARVFGWREWYSDYDEMLLKADVEAVLIATPIPFHYAQVMKALQAGKHVYVQKTMTTSLAEANDVVETAQRKALKLVASPGQMLRPQNQQIKRLLKEGVIGKVYWAFTTNAGGGHEYESLRSGAGIREAIDPTWYYKQGGGPVYDMAVYSLHTLTGMLGPVRRVTAMSGVGLPQRTWRDKVIDVEMDDNTLLLLDFGDSVFALAGGQNAVTSPSIGWGRLTISGTEGALDVVPGRGLEVTSRSALAGTLGFKSGTFVASGGGPGDLPGVVGPHVAIQEPHVYADILHLVDCLREDRTPVVTGAHARHVVEIIEKGYLAARTGQTQELQSTFS